MIYDYIPYFLVGLKGTLFVLGVAFFLNGLDELFIDLVKIGRDLYRYFFVFGFMKREPLSEKQLLVVPEKPVAIMIPCWDESAVIRRMVENTLTVLNYSNFTLFVGVYPNDPATQREVNLVREKHDNVEMIVCPKDGPTSKADCLNWIFEGIRLFEKEHGTSFEIFVIEDSEDVLHPLTLKLFNFLVPKVDMVQLPVYPMEAALEEFTRGTYMDEFAENHSRDLIVRELLTHSIPSAGVGTAFSRDILLRVASESNNQLFKIGTVTEDYEFGIRLAKYRVKQIFSRIRFARTRMVKGFLSDKERPRKLYDYICVREYFPNTLRAAVRQKARWVVGITMQGWKSIGWRGGFWERYMLFRDRKNLVTNQMNALANLLVPIFVAIWVIQALYTDSYHYPPIVVEGSLLWYILIFNVGFLFWRACMRFYYVNSIYGVRQAFLSPFRLIWGNIINYLATLRAIKLYLRYIVSGVPVAWDKTDHVFPSEEELRGFRRRLGDLLLERRFLTLPQLDQALEVQKRTGMPLGAVLVDNGFVDDQHLLQVLGIQFSLQTTELDPYKVPLEIIALIPGELARKYRVFPMGVTDSGGIIVATDAIPKPEAIRSLEQVTGRSISLRLTTRGEFGFAVERGYSRLEDDRNNAPLLGLKLVESGFISGEQLEEALRRQRIRYRQMGDIVSEFAFLDADEKARAEYLYTSNGHERYGQFLVNEGFISPGQLMEILDVQKKKCPLLGEILVEMGAISEDLLYEVLYKDQPHAAKN